VRFINASVGLVVIFAGYSQLRLFARPLTVKFFSMRVP